MADEEKPDSISISITGYTARRLDESIRDYVFQYFSGYYNDGENKFEGILNAMAREMIADALKDHADQMRSMVADQIRDVLNGEIEIGRGFPRKKGTMSEYIADLFGEVRFSAPREVMEKTKQGKGFTFVEFVAWEAARGQIEEEAKRLVSQMKEDLQAQIAANLADQMAVRMLKGVP